MSHGYPHNRENHARAMLILSVYFYPRRFKMAQYGSMFTLKDSSHNMEVGMELLVDAKIMKESENELHKKVYGIVASISSNIDYRDQDEDSIDQEFNNMIAIGNLEANRKPDAKIDAKEGNKKRKKVNQQDAHNTDSVNSVH